MQIKRGTVGTLLAAVGGLLLVTVLGCFIYAHQDSVLVYYHCRRCLQNDFECPESHAWLGSHQRLAVPVLLEYLKEPGDDARDAGRLVEAFLRDHPDPTDPEYVHLNFGIVAKLHQHWPDLSTEGRLAAVSIAHESLRQHLTCWSPNVPSVLTTAGEIMLFGLRHTDPTVKIGALEALTPIWTWEGANDVPGFLVRDWKRNCYLAVSETLRSDSIPLRAAAARALVGCPFHESDPLVAAMLEEESPELISAALGAISSLGLDALNSSQRERLLTLLHATDADVAAGAKRVLMGSGLLEEDVQLLTEATHPDPAVRQTVVLRLLQSEESTHQAWAARLSYDPDTAVRSAFVAHAPLNQPDYRSRIAQIAHADPAPEIRKLAQKQLTSGK